MQHPIMSAVALLLSGVVLAGCTELAAGVAGGVLRTCPKFAAVPA